ncbi:MULTISPECIES: hypothetical protein [Rhizobium]|uniref:Uncharacterized protein n=1 Tax=Rhizobium changzhiense TaxID=2692317 RepID=A0A7Z0RLE8_9HYPH|nr:MULTISPECIES: hypothetical protein [Rhizobium]MBA5800223.1 hypothetical protein [Rhizobium changzhiense]MCH4547565.1 hypothetical protein [Rhizobium changzhiense]MCW0018876.1 hypothetical protein [Rhizobium sp. BT-226]NNU48747.1 hypothetical protein [Rhizobium changzhiense]NZD63709.1 hypothetical protein [Rhizobium changzhiense]
MGEKSNKVIAMLAPVTNDGDNSGQPSAASFEASALAYKPLEDRPIDTAWTSQPIDAS